jgi:hypothetical protein
MKVSLTDRAIRGAEAPNGRVELGDAGCRGLSIRCSPSGVNSWTFAYKIKVEKDGNPHLGEPSQRAWKAGGCTPASCFFTEQIEPDRDSGVRA